MSWGLRQTKAGEHQTTKPKMRPDQHPGCRPTRQVWYHVRKLRSHFGVSVLAASAATNRGSLGTHANVSFKAGQGMTASLTEALMSLRVPGMRKVAQVSKSPCNEAVGKKENASNLAVVLQSLSRAADEADQPSPLAA